MGNIISLLKWLLNSFTIVVIALVLVWWFRNTPVVRNAILLSIGLFIFTFYVSPLPNVIAAFWERKYNAFNKDFVKDTHEGINVHIIVLGSGYSNDPSLSVTSKLSDKTALRLIEAVRIYNELDSTKIITSGASLWQDKSSSI